MEALRYNGPVEFMRPIVEAWRSEANPDQFGFEMDADRFLETLRDLANTPDAVLILLGHEGRCVGFMGGVLFDSPVNRDKCVQDKYWFVLPRHRGRSVVKLKKALEDWAREKGATHLLMSASMLASDRHDGVCKLYARTMKKFETTFIQELNHGMLQLTQDTSSATTDIAPAAAGDAGSTAITHPVAGGAI